MPCHAMLRHANTQRDATQRNLTTSYPALVYLSSLAGGIISLAYLGNPDLPTLGT